jgi:hypothetical protein
VLKEFHGKLNYLPWRIQPDRPATIIDSAGCLVADLSYFYAVGKGHDPVTIAKLLVESANATFQVPLSPITTPVLEVASKGSSLSG